MKRALQEYYDGLREEFAQESKDFWRFLEDQSKFFDTRISRVLSDAFWVYMPEKSRDENARALWIPGPTDFKSDKKSHLATNYMTPNSRPTSVMDAEQPPASPVNYYSSSRPGASPMDGITSSQRATGILPTLA